MNLPLAARGLRYCAGLSPVVEQGHTWLRCTGFSLRWLLLLPSMGASLVASPRSRAKGSVVVVPGLQLLRGLWNLPRPGIRPASPCVAGGLPSTVSAVRLSPARCRRRKRQSEPGGQSAVPEDGHRGASTDQRHLKVELKSWRCWAGKIGGLHDFHGSLSKLGADN